MGENICERLKAVAIHESFLREIGGVAAFGSCTSEQSAKAFLAKILLSALYGIY